MSETRPLSAPAAHDWTWAPERAGFGGYAGTCVIGPFTFTISAKQKFSQGWELRGSVKLAGVTMASHSWESDTLSCTPDGIVAEVGERGVLSQLAETTRHRVTEATRLLEEFDVISRAWLPHDDTAS